jgi:hypothetical protein
MLVVAESETGSFGMNYVNFCWEQLWYVLRDFVAQSDRAYLMSCVSQYICEIVYNIVSFVPRVEGEGT